MLDLPPTPKTHFATFQLKDFETINNGYERGPTLEEVALSQPSKACNLLHALLIRNGQIMPDVRVQTDVGFITSEMDGPQIARDIFLRTLENSVAGGVVFEPFEVVLFSFAASRTSAEQKFKISLEPPAYTH